MSKHLSLVLVLLFSSLSAIAAKDSLFLRKAKELTLEQERLKVSQVLNRGIDRSSPGQQKQQLKKALNKFMRVFYTEKAQILFEQAKVFRVQDTEISEKKFEEALKIEPYNTELLTHYAQFELSNEKCSAALRKLLRSLKLNPYDSTSRSLLLDAYSCEEAWEELEKELVVHSKKMGSSLSFLNARVQVENEKKAFNKVLALTNRMLKEDPNYPLAFYWRWKVLLEQKRPNRIEAMKYVELCKKKGLVFSKQKYFLAPRSCRYQKEVASYLSELEKKSG